MAFGAAVPAHAGIRAAAMRFVHLQGNDARGHGDDPVPHDHDQGRHGLAERRDRRDVAVANGAEGRHRPVDAAGNAAEAFVHRALNDVHERAKDHHQRQHGADEHDDFANAGAHRVQQQIGLAHIANHPQHAKHPQHAQNTNHQQVLGTGPEQANERRQNAQQIHNAEKAERVGPGLPDTPEPDHVLRQKENRENPFRDVQGAAVAGMHRRHRIEHDGRHAEKDGDDERHVEGRPGRRLCFEDDDPHVFAQRRWIFGGHRGANG